MKIIFEGKRAKRALSKFAAQVAEATQFVRETFVGKDCRHAPGGPPYCGDCPLSWLGGEEGEPRPSYEVSGMLCSLPRHYSK